MMKKLLSCAVALAFFSGVASASSNLVVSTEGGQLEGFTKTVPGTQSKVETFLAVPFAAAPVGENRWTSAQPVVPWKGVKKANKAPQACRQGDVGSEDCLYVNIYRPAGTKKDAKLAVGVYAHGGGNTGGNATEHDGARLASENNIIVVTLQYRLGAFGFLTLPGMDESAGNFGVTDTESALAWVRRNIANFGGDADNVVLMTESAGSTNACRILVDPKAKGLVDGVILQSEDCIHDVDTVKQAQARSEQFLKLTKCDEAKDALSCVRKLTTEQVAAASKSVGLWNPVSDVPAVEAIRQGKWIKVPVLSGSNKEEGRSAGTAYTDWNAKDYEAWVKRLVGKNAPEALKLYPADKYQGKYAISYVIGDFITDSGMRGLGGCTNLTLAQELSKDKSVATYIYTFEDSTVPTSRKFADYDDAASHASELTYFFPDAGQYQARSVKMTEAQKVLAKEMRQYWGNFIKTQNPNGKSLPQWKRFSDDGGSMMALRLNGQSQSVPASYFSELHQCKFWHSIPIVLDRGDR